jgi:nucleotide-binding universal stress UspA family protein
MACLDGSPSMPAVCDYAIWAALRLDVPLDFVHVLDAAEYPAVTATGELDARAAPLDAQRNRQAQEVGRRMLDDAHARAGARGIANAGTVQREGGLVDVLLELEGDIRLLVIGRDGLQRDGDGARVGARLESIVRVLHRPILLVPAGAVFQLPQRIMIAFDDTPMTRKAVEVVAASHLFRGLPCHVTIAGGKTPETASQLDWARRILATAGYEVTSDILVGDPATVLCAYAAQHAIDLIVMGAYGHSKIREFLIGSTTEQLIAESKVPLLLLR